MLKMRFSLVLATLLCFTKWMSMVQATHGPVATCCPQWRNTQIPDRLIANYTIQSEGICPFAAIMIHTIRNKTLCFDPNNDWAQKVILKLNEERNKKTLQEEGLNEDGSTSDITPTVSATSKHVPQTKGRNGQRRPKKKSKSRKRWPRKCF